MKSTAPKTVVRKPKGPENKWTPEEDEILAAAVAASGFKVCWRKIASSLPGRTNKSCRKRWIHSLDPTLKKGRWTAAEDKVLLNAIKTHGTLWYKVAKHLPGRTDDQAAKRYREKLDPSIARTPWTDDEDEILIRVWKKVGKRWNLISQELNGRPAVHCRNRWQSLLRIGKVDGSEHGADFDYTKCEQDADGDDEEMLPSPIDPSEAERPSTSGSSSSSSSSRSPNLKALQGLGSGSPNFSRNETEGSDDSMALPYPSLDTSRSSSNDLGSMEAMLDSRRPQIQLDQFRSLRTKEDSQLSESSKPKPELFMIPHPNMRIISSQQSNQSPFQFNYATQSVTDSPPSLYLSSYDTSPIPSRHLTPAPMPVSRPVALHSLPPIQTNNLSGGSRTETFMMTCPLVHCGFQNSNLIELWKHVTWHHVDNSSSPPSSQSVSSSFNHIADHNNGMKVDPVMMDIIERFALDQQHQHQLGGYGTVGLHLDEFGPTGLTQPRSLVA